MRKSAWKSATSVGYGFPSAAFNLSCLQVVSNSSAPSFLSRFFNTAQYVLALFGVGWSVRATTTSTTEKYHFSSSSSHAVLIFPVTKQLDRFFLAHTNIVSRVVTKPHVEKQEKNAPGPAKTHAPPTTVQFPPAKVSTRCSSHFCARRLREGLIVVFANNFSSTSCLFQPRRQRKDPGIVFANSANPVSRRLNLPSRAINYKA